jgi:hypothetical protein
MDIILRAAISCYRDGRALTRFSDGRRHQLCAGDDLQQSTFIAEVVKLFDGLVDILPCDSRFRGENSRDARQTSNYSADHSMIAVPPGARVWPLSSATRLFQFAGSMPIRSDALRTLSFLVALKSSDLTRQTNSKLQSRHRQTRSSRPPPA